jgi:hypothetical protein
MAAQRSAALMAMGAILTETSLQDDNYDEPSDPIVVAHQSVEFPPRMTPARGFDD